MATGIAVRSGAQIAEARPAAGMPSLPACAMSRLGSLGGKISAPTLPRDLMLTDRDQVAIRQAISNYRSALAQEVPARSGAAAERMGAVLGAMFMAWPMFGASREQISAMTVRYLGAVAEFPPRLVQAAIDRWRDGRWKLEFGESFDKIPSSATLRRICEHLRTVAENELAYLERLDAAVAEIPPAAPSPEERERIGQKFQELSKELGEKIAARSGRGRQAYLDRQESADA